MNWIFNGLPMHPLLVHLAVVLVPLSSLLLVLHVSWPAARRRLGWVTPAVALAALIAIILTKEAGEALERQSSETQILETHTRLGGQMLPWVVGITIVSMLVWGWFAFAVPRLKPARLPRAVALVVLLIGAIGIVIPANVLLFQVGETGAKSVWGDATASTAVADSTGQSGGDRDGDAE